MSCIGVTGEFRESKLFEWKITDFFTLSAKKGCSYKSPSFVINNTSFHLKIYPEGATKAKCGFISLYLTNESNIAVNVSYIFYIKKADRSLIASLGSNDILQPSEGRGFCNFYDRSALLEDKSVLVPSGILTLVCILKFASNGKEVPVKADNKKTTNEEKTPKTLDCRKFTALGVLSEDLRELSTKKDSCDVILKVEDKEFKAHRAILMARSCVFAAMFQHDTLEKQTGIIKISDCDSESFQEFLDYLYCGKLEDVTFRSAFHLYSTSKKYDVEQLKEFCLDYLKGNLTVDNMCDAVLLADKYDETELMTKVQDFFNENCYKVIPTSEWEGLLKDNFRLANRLLVALSKFKQSQ